MPTPRCFSALIPMVGLSLVGCAAEEPEPEVVYVEPRDPCAAHSPLRSAFFGDLHRRRARRNQRRNENCAGEGKDRARGI